MGKKHEKDEEFEKCQKLIYGMANRGAYKSLIQAIPWFEENYVPRLLHTAHCLEMLSHINLDQLDSAEKIARSLLQAHDQGELASHESFMMFFNWTSIALKKKDISRWNTLMLQAERYANTPQRKELVKNHRNKVFKEHRKVFFSGLTESIMEAGDE